MATALRRDAMAVAPSTDQPRTILGPLTTTFTQPPACTQVIAQCSTCTSAWQAQECYKNGNSYGIQDHTACWPPLSGVASVISFGPTLAGYGFFSPGLVCPHGYTSACSATAGGYSGWDVEYSMVPKETAVGCCPTGYFCTNLPGLWQSCITIATSTDILTANCVSGTSNAAAHLTLPATITATPADHSAAITTTLTAYSLFAPLIQLNFQASDLKSSSSTTTSAATTSSPTAASSIPTASSSQSQPQTSFAATQNSTGLSTGAKAGIGVAVGVAGIAIVIAAVAAYLLMRRRREPGPKAEPTAFQPEGINKPYNSISELQQPTPELETNKEYRPVHELGS